MTSLIIVIENPLYDCLLKIGLSFLCGAILGIERRTRQQFIGLRTLILICLFLWLVPLPSKLKKYKNQFFHCGAELWKFVIPVSRREALWPIMIYLQKSL